MEHCSAIMRLVKGLLERCVEVTELLAGSAGPRRLSDIAQSLDLPKGAAHRLLRELCVQGWMAQDGTDGPYRLTLRFGLLGHRVLQATGLVDLTQPLLQLLADRTHELARLTVVTGNEANGNKANGTGLAGFRAGSATRAGVSARHGRPTRAARHCQRQGVPGHTG
jgi:hypothetical protein